MAQTTKGQSGAAAAKLMYPRELLAKLLKARQIKAGRLEIETLSTILDTVFFASQMVEEGEAVRVAVVHAAKGAAELETMLDYSPPDEEGYPTWDVTRISPLDLNANSLAKFARALEYGKQVAVIGGTGRKLRIEGAARRLPRTGGGKAIRIAAPRPGVLVFERGVGELFRFDAGAHVARRIDVLGERGPVRDAIARVSGVASGPSDGYSNVEWALKQLLPKVRSLGAGAIIAISAVPPSPDAIRAIKYRRADPSVLGRRISGEYDQRWDYLWKRIDAAGGDLPQEKATELEIAREGAERARSMLDASIDDVAHLSAVDGAVLVGPGLAVYGGGYLIQSLKDEDLPERVLARDASGESPVPYHGSHGARHKAAFSFACLEEGNVAFVISEDGPINCVMRMNGRIVVWPVQTLET